MSFKVEIQTDNTGNWYDNAVRTGTREEAERYAKNLARRWLLVNKWRIVESDLPANYTADADGVLTRIGDLP